MCLKIVLNFNFNVNIVNKNYTFIWKVNYTENDEKQKIMFFSTLVPSPKIITVNCHVYIFRSKLCLYTYNMEIYI